MRQETKVLLQSKLHRFVTETKTHKIDPTGTWIHVRDLRTILNCETELLKKQIEKLKNHALQE